MKEAADTASGTCGRLLRVRRRAEADQQEERQQRF